MNRTTWLQDRRMQKFRDVLSRWERKELSAMEAGELLGCSERQFRRYRVRYEEEGIEGLVDKRLGRASEKRVPVDEVAWMLDEYRTHYRGWNVKHFHEQLSERHSFHWGYTFGEDAAARGRAGGARQAPRRAPAQAAAQAVRGHDAAPGRMSVANRCGERRGSMASCSSSGSTSGRPLWQNT